MVLLANDEEEASSIQKTYPIEDLNEQTISYFKPK